MITRSFHELSLPALGLGCMRLPVDEDKKIKEDAVAEMIDFALSEGVNYFDTGYDYHGGMSESVVCKILSKYRRESYYIADKFPAYYPGHWRRAGRIFNEQLSRCGLEYFDFYLIHNVSELNINALLDPKYKIMEYFIKERDDGRIRHFGFSAHGTPETIERLLREYGSEFEFAQIQLNYIDYEFQDAKAKLDLLGKYGLPVFVMEPLRGGKLASPPARFRDKISALLPNMSFAEAAFRFVRSFTEVVLTLSGMSDIEQLKSNIITHSDGRTLTDAERRGLIEIASEMTSVGTIPCTGCRYCTEHCPASLDIPGLIGYYNEHTYSGGGFIVPSAVASMKQNERPTACIGCRACEKVCPQGIKIADVIDDLCKKINLK